MKIPWLFWRSPDNTNWSLQGFSTRNTTLHYVGLTGIDAFSRWTLSSPSNPLPVTFISFSAKCNSGKVLLIWKTAQEINTSHYDIERTYNSGNWSVTGTVPAAQATGTQNDYSFTDNNPEQRNYYRIAEYDLNGRPQNTSVVNTACESNDVFMLWPNPASQNVYINMSVANNTKAFINVFDSKGALIKMQNYSLVQGSNRLMVDVSGFAGGVYQFVITWNNGSDQRTVRVVKQQ